MKEFLIMGLIGAAFLLTSTGSSAEIKKAEKEEFFSAKGTLTQVAPEQKTLSLKNEGGLELTFHTKDSAPVTGLAVGDSVEIDYLYNENYEKVVQSIRKQVSSQKTQGPATS